MKNYNKSLLDQLTYISLESKDSIFKSIADVILKNKSNINKFTINMIADLAFTSVSSITRFCQSLDADGYKEFVYRIKWEYEMNNKSIDELSDSRSELETYKIIDDVLEDQKLFFKREMSKIEKITKKIKEKRKIYLVGVKEFLSILWEFKNDLSWKEIIAIFSRDRDNQIRFVQGAQENDLVLLASWNMFDEHAKKCLDIAYDKGCKIILLSKNEFYNSNKKVDLFINLSSDENISNAFQLPKILLLFKIIIKYL